MTFLCLFASVCFYSIGQPQWGLFFFGMMLPALVFDVACENN